MSDDHLSYARWRDLTVEKIVDLGLSVPEEHRADYLRVQIRNAIEQALRHGRTGLPDDAPVAV